MESFLWQFPYPTSADSRIDWLIVLGFNDTSTLEGHFVSSPREREKRDRRESRGDEREGQGRKRNRNESEETEEIKTFPPLPLPTTRIAGLAQLYADISWTPQWCKIHSTFALRLIVLEFNNTSTLVGHFVSSPREREKRDSRGDQRGGQGRKRNRNESEETE